MGGISMTFKKKYLTKHYFDDNATKFHDFKVSQISMDDLVMKFIDILRYVPYICEEKAKVQHFIKFIALYFKEKIEYCLVNLTF